MLILGIESSCDETGIAVVEVNNRRFSIRSNVVASQARIHSRYGGVVPEVAARNHIKNIIPVLNEALRQARVTPKKIDRIAVTVGPGLVTSLIVGIETARTLALAWDKPVVPVNHMHGHLYAPWLTGERVKFPALVLIVSGGHTELVLMSSATKMKKIGQTIDDAAGEAFDKVAQLLGLKYPGGPEISRVAKHGDPTAFDLPRPMLKSGDFNFSFSGLKTAVLYTIKGLGARGKGKARTGVLHPYPLSLTPNLAASFQQAVVDVLVTKTLRAAEKYKVKTVLLSGGVAANVALREQLHHSLRTTHHSLNFVVPPINLCTDNGAIIAAAGCFGKPIAWQKLKVNPELEIH